MNMEEIYKKFDQIGCLSFATIDNGYPQTRIAHLFAYDDDGLYFRTMVTKPFYEQLKKHEKLSICGMYPETQVSHDEQGWAYFKPGYTIRATGDIKEVTMDELKEKATKSKMFKLGVMDVEKYPAMTTFCMHRGWGEVYDFDFEMEKRDHKLIRTGFCFGRENIPFRGMKITDQCVMCGECMEKCSFKAISEGEDRYVIDHNRCDACGDCFTVCPADAIEILIDKP